MKVVINTCYGGFSLSPHAFKRYLELKGKEASREEGTCFSDHDIPRTDPALIQVIEELGAGHKTGASGSYADLTIVEIPDDIDYEIEEYDGNEWISEKHRTWR